MIHNFLYPVLENASEMDVQLKTNFQAAAFKRPSERDVERKESINKARLWQNKITKAVESSTEFVVELMHTPAASAAG